ncbi:putative agamous-like MADS-box protein AGL53 [Cocos nucifera]|uniref:Putative agamous-like MADS-box protein AGL53 n=1 Tax=Cocos nucifera TaxID=13894 RepID=A0A8K0IN16_COCNU|nr:putative agamous-like MADS-box protein AGL53 [Cocos nucifera]
MSEESLGEMLCSMASGMEAVKKRIQLLKENSRCNQGDLHGDTGGVQQQGFQCNNPAFMEECSDVPMVSKAPMDDGPGQGHGAFVPMEIKQVKGVAANACLPCSSTASRDFNYELKAPAFSMPLIFMPPPSTGATSEHDIASGTDRPFLPQENQFVIL